MFPLQLYTATHIEMDKLDLRLSCSVIDNSSSKQQILILIKMDYFKKNLGILKCRFLKKKSEVSKKNLCILTSEHLNSFKTLFFFKKYAQIHNSLLSTKILNKTRSELLYPIPYRCHTCVDVWALFCQSILSVPPYTPPCHWRCGEVSLSLGIEKTALSSFPVTK